MKDLVVGGEREIAVRLEEHRAALTADRRRALPMDLSEPAPGISPPSALQDTAVWIGPCPGGAPEAAVTASESVRWRSSSRSSTLPPRQRATLILRDALGFSAREVAELHGSTVASANSALQRVRTTPAVPRGPAGALGARPADTVHRVLAERYATAFSRYDMQELNMLLRVDATP